jgi:long-chain acyl-CoA synthetase
LNIAQRLAASAARLPDKTALIFGAEQLTYAELDARVDRGAAVLQELGVRPGDRIALMVANSTRFVEAFYAAMRAGAVVVPLNVTYTAEEIRHILSDAGAVLAVVDEPFYRTLAAVRDRVDTLEHLIPAGTANPKEGGPPWRARVAAASDPEPVEVSTEDLALLQYTSGTTGRPKGAMLTHANLLANQEQMEQTRLSVEEGDVVLSALPLFHIYALNVGMAFTLCKGATLLLVERFDPQQTLAEIARHRASVIIGAPPMYIAWINLPDIETYDLASVRFAVSGAAPLPARVLERFRDELGIAIWEGYGLTETAPLLTTVAMGEELKPGSVGRPVPGVEIRLVDEKGESVRRGDPGEVVVRGPNVFRGYWHQPEATAEVLDDDGWFHTGDIGIATDGNLYLVDRKKDLIIVSGFNVYPREVEEVLYRHPKVAEAAVIGVPHPYTGEAVKAVVVLKEGEESSAEEIIEHCRHHLARFKNPEVVEFAESLPMLPSGKVKRRDLREEPA